MQKWCRFGFRAYSQWASALVLINGTIGFYCIIHIERYQTSKGKIANATLTVNRPLEIGQCEYTLPKWIILKGFLELSFV